MQPSKAIRIMALFTACLGLSACLTSPEPQTPAMYASLNRTGAKINLQEALVIINAYRRNHGLSQLTLSNKLVTAAQEQADAMARADKVNHALTRDKTLAKRLKRAKYDAVLAVENISAGYWSLAEAFSGWRDSRRHNANMLREGVTEMGIATQYRPDAKYKVFWALILAKPDEQTLPKKKPQARPMDLFSQ